MGAEAAHLMNPQAGVNPTTANAEGSDGDNGQENPNPPAKVFTQDELNSILSRHKKELKKELEAERASRTALEQKLAAFLDEKDKPTVEDKTADGRLEALEKRYERKLSEIQAELETAKATAEAERKARDEAERDRLINAALTSVCNNAELGLLWAKARITKVDEDGEPLDTWVMRGPNGKLVDIQTGITEHLPKELRSPSAAGGGAGTGSGLPGGKAGNKLKQLEQQVEAAKKQAEASRKTEDLIAYRNAKKQLDAARAASSKSP